MPLQVHQVPRDGRARAVGGKGRVIVAGSSVHKSSSTSEIAFDTSSASDVFLYLVCEGTRGRSASINLDGFLRTI